MKKTLLIAIALVTSIIVAGCGSSNEESETGSQETENNTNSEVEQLNSESDMNTEEDEAESENKTTSEEEETAETASQGENIEDVQLQLSKVDEEAGVTLEDSQVYRVLNDTIQADPKIGTPNLVNLYPYDVIMDENGNRSLLFLIVNRLPDSITDLSLTMTYGNKNGGYLWENQVVNIPEEQIGILKTNHAVPFSLSISAEQKEIFETINEKNADLQISDFEMEVVE